MYPHTDIVVQLNLIPSPPTSVPPNHARIEQDCYSTLLTSSYSLRALMRLTPTELGQTENKRHCADPTTVLYAVSGTEYFGEVGPGACDVREDGFTRWNSGRDKQHFYNTQKLPTEELEAVMESCSQAAEARQKVEEKCHLAARHGNRAECGCVWRRDPPTGLRQGQFLSVCARF